MSKAFPAGMDQARVASSPDVPAKGQLINGAAHGHLMGKWRDMGMVLTPAAAPYQSQENLEHLEDIIRILRTESTGANF